MFTPATLAAVAPLVLGLSQAAVLGDAQAQIGINLRSNVTRQPTQHQVPIYSDPARALAQNLLQSLDPITSGDIQSYQCEQHDKPCFQKYWEQYHYCHPFDRECYKDSDDYPYYKDQCRDQHGHGCYDECYYDRRGCDHYQECRDDDHTCYKKNSPWEDNDESYPPAPFPGYPDDGPPCPPWDYNCKHKPDHDCQPWEKDCREQYPCPSNYTDCHKHDDNCFPWDRECHKHFDCPSDDRECHKQDNYCHPWDEQCHKQECQPDKPCYPDWDGYHEHEDEDKWEPHGHVKVQFYGPEGVYKAETWPKGQEEYTEKNTFVVDHIKYYVDQEDRKVRCIPMLNWFPWTPLPLKEFVSKGEEGGLHVRILYLDRPQPVEIFRCDLP